jgi:hypothetical protein
MDNVRGHNICINVFVLMYHSQKLLYLIYDRSCLHFSYNWRYN